MKNLKIIDLLQTLSAEELKDFEKFVKSPFYNTSKNVEKLFAVLKKLYPEFEGKSTERENLFSKVFPGKEYNNQVMKNISSELMKLGEEYFFIVTMRRNHHEIKIHIIDEMQYRGLFQHTDKMLDDLETDLEKNTSCCEKIDYFNQYLFSLLKKQQYIKSDRQDAQKENSKQMFYLVNYFLTLMTDNLESEYIGWYNKNLGEENSLVRLFSECILGKKDFGEIIEFIKKDNPSDGIPAEAFYRFSKLILSEPVYEDYVKLKELFMGNLDKFSHAAKYNFLSNLETAHTIVRAGKNCPDNEKEEHFEIYEFEFRYGLFSTDPGRPMRQQFYRSMLMAAIAVKKLDWIEMFIETGTPMLIKENQDNMRNFAEAHLCFLKKEFNQSLQYILKIDINMFTFKYDIKLLQLMIYFELGYFEEAFSMVDTFKHFLSNNKNVNELRREQHNGFVNCYTDLLKCKTASSKKETAEIKMELDTFYGSLRYKDWLYEKAGELL